MTVWLFVCLFSFSSHLFRTLKLVWAEFQSLYSMPFDGQLGIGLIYSANLHPCVQPANVAGALCGLQCLHSPKICLTNRNRKGGACNKRQLLFVLYDPVKVHNKSVHSWKALTQCVPSHWTALVRSRHYLEKVVRICASIIFKQTFQSTDLRVLGLACKSIPPFSAFTLSKRHSPLTEPPD